MKSYESQNICMQTGTGDSTKPKPISIIQSFFITDSSERKSDCTQHSNYKIGPENFFGDEPMAGGSFLRKMVMLGDKTQNHDHMCT